MVKLADVIQCKKKLNVVIYEEYDQHIHGNQRYICLLGKSLNTSGEVELSLITSKEGALAEQAKDFSIATTSLNGGNVFIRSIALFRLLRRKRPDVLLANNERSLLIAHPSIILLKIPSIWFIKNLRHSWWSDLLCFMTADRVLAIIPEAVEIKGMLAKLFSKKIYFQKIGFDPDPFLSVPSLAERRGQMVNVLVLAAICPAKGIDILLSVLQLLDQRNVSFKCTICGAVPQGYEKYASNMRAVSEKFTHICVEWAGWRSETPDLISSSDIVVLTSRSETVGRSLLEGMAAGRPVIATNVGGLTRTVLDGETGFIVPLGDIPGLANALEKLVKNRDMREKMGARARKHVLHHFSIQEHCKEMVHHFKSVIKNQS